MEQLFRANDTRKFYEKVYRSRKGYLCRDVEGNLLTEESEVNENLNGDEMA